MNCHAPEMSKPLFRQSGSPNTPMCACRLRKSAPKHETSPTGEPVSLRTTNCAVTPSHSRRWNESGLGVTPRKR